MRAQAEELAKLAKGLKDEIQGMEYFDTSSRTIITEYVDIYSNDDRNFIHVQFNKGNNKPVDITIHHYNEKFYFESLNIDLSITDYELDIIVERSKDVVEKFKEIHEHLAEEIRLQKIEDLEYELAKLRGEV